MTHARSRSLVGIAVLGLLAGAGPRAQDATQFGLHLSEDALTAVAAKARASPDSRMRRVHSFMLVSFPFSLAVPR